MKSEVIKSDVLVLGGGIAACNAAIKARESGLNVVLVDKGNVGRSGLSPCMSGVLTYFDPKEDDYDAWYEECVEVGAWINDQNCLEGIINESTHCIRDMESWGAVFHKKDGDFIRKPGVGQIHARNILMAYGGLQLMLSLRGEVFRCGIHVVERVMTTNLLTSDGEEMTSGRVVGAVGFHVRSGKFYVFQAKTTIIATGPTMSVLVRCRHSHLSGDGIGMAFRAGAEMRNFDLVKDALRLRDFIAPIGPGQNIFVSEGAYFINAKGERFMHKYDPRRMEGSDRALVSRAVAVEEKEGRGPIYVNCTHLSDASHARIEKAIPLVIKSLATIGQSFRKDLIPYCNGMSNCSVGGIRINKEGATTIPGLYAAGGASDHGDEGVSEVITPGTVSAIIGQRAGEAAAKYAVEIEEPIVNEYQVEWLKEQIFAPMKKGAGLRHREVREHCRNLLERGLLGPFKNERGLEEAIHITQEIKEGEIPKLVARDYHELARTVSLRGELLFLDLVARCSLLRTESRGSHYREDYPARDDENWLKWVVAKREGDSIKAWVESIPFEEYRLKPELAKWTN